MNNILITIILGSSLLLFGCHNKSAVKNLEELISYAQRFDIDLDFGGGDDVTGAVHYKAQSKDRVVYQKDDSVDGLSFFGIDVSG